MDEIHQQTTDLVVQSIFHTFFKADEGNMLNEAGEGEECGVNDVVMERTH